MDEQKSEELLKENGADEDSDQPKKEEDQSSDEETNSKTETDDNNEKDKSSKESTEGKILLFKTKFYFILIAFIFYIFISSFSLLIDQNKSGIFGGPAIIQPIREI